MKPQIQLASYGERCGHRIWSFFFAYYFTVRWIICFQKKTAMCYLQLFSLFSKATKCAHFEGRKIVIWQLVFKVPESDTLGLLWWWWRCGALLMGNSEQLECSMSSGLQVCSLFSLDQFPTTKLLLDSWHAKHGSFPLAILKMPRPCGSHPQWARPKVQRMCGGIVCSSMYWSPQRIW